MNVEILLLTLGSRLGFPRFELQLILVCMIIFVSFNAVPLRFILRFILRLEFLKNLLTATERDDETAHGVRGTMDNSRRQVG